MSVYRSKPAIAFWLATPMASNPLRRRSVREPRSADSHRVWTPERTSRPTSRFAASPAAAAHERPTSSPSGQRSLISLLLFGHWCSAPRPGIPSASRPGVARACPPASGRFSGAYRGTDVCYKNLGRRSGDRLTKYLFRRRVGVCQGWSNGSSRDRGFQQPQRTVPFP